MRNKITIMDISLDEIIVMKRYKENPPSEKTLNKKRKYYAEHNSLDWIVLDKNYLLCDGFASYLVAKENHIDVVRCAIADFAFNGYVGTFKRIAQILQNKNDEQEFTYEQELTDVMEKKSERNLEKAKVQYGDQTQLKWDGGEFSTKKRYALYLRSGGICPVCGNEMTFKVKEAPDRNKFSIDHIIPRHLGGRNSSENLMGMCARCNNIKTDIMPDVFKNQFKSAMAEEVLRESEYQNMLLRKIIKDKFVRRMDRIRTAIL